MEAPNDLKDRSRLSETDPSAILREGPINLPSRNWSIWQMACFGVPVTVRYRLLRRIVGMYHGDIGATMIPAGAVVEISPTRSKVGIITASHDDRMLWVFL